MNGVEVGRAWLYLIDNDLHEFPYGLLEDVYVDPEYRGRGYASALVQEVVVLAERHGCYKLIATSRTERERVHRLYLELGFVRHGIEFRIDL